MSSPVSICDDCRATSVDRCWRHSTVVAGTNVPSEWVRVEAGIEDQLAGLLANTHRGRNAMRKALGVLPAEEEA